jgi:uncharacterized protein YndB with AHSA1/START domain
MLLPMTPEEPLTVTREAELDVDTEQLWHALTNEAELAAWLGDEVALDVREGGHGTVLDDGVLRHVRVDRVREGRELAFTWWEDGDAGATSSVRFTLEARPDGASRLAIVETFEPRASDGPVAKASSATRDRWGVRILCLWACTAAAVALVR